MILKNKKAQAISEYLILVALIAIASIGIVQVLGSNIQKRLGTIAAAIGGKKREIKANKVEEKHFQIRDLGDFDGAAQENAD